MIRKSLYLAIYCGILVYLVLNIYWGEQGVVALRALRIERTTFEHNLESLTRENQYNQSLLVQLKDDRVSLSQQARKMGYIQAGETIVYTNLSSGQGLSHYDLPLLRTASPRILPRGPGVFRVFSIFVILLVFLLTLIFEWGQRGIRRPLS